MTLSALDDYLEVVNEPPSLPKELRYGIHRYLGELNGLSRELRPIPYLLQVQ